MDGWSRTLLPASSDYQREVIFFTMHHTVRLWSCPSHKVVRFNSHKDQMLYTGPSTTPLHFWPWKVKGQGHAGNKCENAEVSFGSNSRHKCSDLLWVKTKIWRVRGLVRLLCLALQSFWFTVRFANWQLADSIKAPTEDILHICNLSNYDHKKLYIKN